MVFDHEAEHPSRWAAIQSIVGKIGCTAQALNEWTKRAEVDAGRKAGATSDIRLTQGATARAKVIRDASAAEFMMSSGRSRTKRPNI